jgi:hypothetical protein
MKQIVIMMLLMGGAVGTQAQEKNSGNAHEKGYRVHAGGRWDDCSKSYRGAYYDCRPGVKPATTPAVAPVAAPATEVVAKPAPAAAPAYVHKQKAVQTASM